MVERLTVDTETKSKIIAAHCPSGRKGEHHVRLCAICAAPDWQGTYNNRPDDLVLTIEDTPCSRCQEFRHRFPDVFHFIVAVFSGQRLLAKLKGIPHA